MTNRSRAIETLFQRMGAAGAGKHDPAIEKDAASAIGQWPLLAMLTLGPRETGERAATPKATIPPVQPPIPPVNEPARSARVVSAPISPVVTAPNLPVPPPGPAIQISPLQQLFLRAEQTGKGATMPASVFVPPPLKVPAGKVATTQPSVFTPPPLKTRAATRPAPTVAAEGPLTIEPKPPQWREPDSLPAQLFERAVAR